jgi:hypothetical protein
VRGCAWAVTADALMNQWAEMARIAVGCTDAPNSDHARV